MSFSFREELQEIKKILNSKIEVEKVKKYNPEEDSTFENGVRSWIGSIFVDIADSSSLFESNDISDKTKARIIKAFCHGLINIFNDKAIDVGIRGDCVYAVFSTPYKTDIKEMFDTACSANTFMNMLNKQLSNQGFPTIKAGIGMACSEDLIVVAGAKRKVKDYIWIGECLVEANKLSKIANRGSHLPMALTGLLYSNVIDELVKENEKSKGWFFQKRESSYTDPYYECDVIYTGINDWINNNFKD